MATPRALAFAAVCLVPGLVPAGAAFAQGSEFLARANSAYADIRADRRSDTVLLPAIAEMDNPPPAAASPFSAARLTEGAPGWSAAKRWAEAPAQVDALEALATVTAETNWRRSFGFGQRYGSAGIDAMLIERNLYTDLGVPPTLGLARFGYLDGLNRLSALVYVEATRRQAEGDPGGAADVCVDLAYLGRQIADRAFAEEARWGLETIAESVERLRVVAYEDFAGERNLTQEAFQRAIDRLELERAYMDLSRLTFPIGDRLALLEVAGRIFPGEGPPDPGAFATTLARLDTGSRPLRLFGQAAAWDGRASAHAPWSETEDEIERAYEDWRQQWELDDFHPRRSAPAYFDGLNSTRFAVISASLGDLGDLFELRRRARVEIVGSRTCLALVAYGYQFGQEPPQVSSVRGRWVQRMDADPYNARNGSTEGPPLEYFVPIRDTRDQFTGEPQPHEISATTARGETITTRVDESGFVVYSFGPDGQKDWARRATSSASAGGSGGTDILLWPPVLGLERAGGS